MGAPKQKWTEEEEAALRAGVARYGPGKWSTILKDSEFNIVLKARSNVDLKDKWRNMNVVASGFGSRQKARLALRNNRPIPEPDGITVAECDNIMPLATLEMDSRKKPISRLDSLISEIITTLKEPRGSSRATITAYIEERYATPPNLERLLAADLKLLTDNGKLIKVKHQYRVAPSSSSFDLRNNPSPLLAEESQMGFTEGETNTVKVLTKSLIDMELEKMRSMTAQDAAAAAMQAVAEAEAAMAAAEQATKEAEIAESEAEAAQAFAAAAMKSWKRMTLCRWS